MKSNKHENETFLKQIQKWEKGKHHNLWDAAKVFLSKHYTEKTPLLKKKKDLKYVI